MSKKKNIWDDMSDGEFVSMFLEGPDGMFDDTKYWELIEGKGDWEDDEF